jgi:hypothetical protein
MRPSTRTASPAPQRLSTGLLTLTAALAAPLAMSVAFGVGCGGPPKGADNAGASSASISASASVVAAADAGAPVVDAATASSGYWPATNAATSSSTAVVVDAGPPPACWAGFKATGNAVTDVNDLGARCTKGMSPVIPPVKQSFAQGEKKQIPLIIPGPGCYRIIAVGGTGVKDVDLEVRDQSGKLIAADNTPDDIFPMIHPNKEWCPDAAQFLTLSIVVKKGTGEVAGGVWKR